jgi:hypothetical protein
MATGANTQDLEQEPPALLEIERFDPPEGFREEALWSDSAVYPSAKTYSSRRCSNGN